jgi:DNA-binding response OmpR family regulator
VETILIAEDHEGLRELARETLTNLGYDILLANHGEEAVRVFQANRDRIDLLLLDVVLPKINGPEAYARICAEKQDVPVIFATGYSPEMELLHSAQELGLTVLQKPYVPREVARRVRKTLHRQPAKIHPAERFAEDEALCWCGHTLAVELLITVRWVANSTDGAAWRRQLELTPFLWA